MAKRPVLDFHLESENLFNPHAEVWLEFVQEAQELISHSSKPTELTLRLMPRKEIGQELEVLL